MQGIAVFGHPSPPEKKWHLIFFSKFYFMISGIYLAMNKNSISKAEGGRREKREGKKDKVW